MEQNDLLLFCLHLDGNVSDDENTRPPPSRAPPKRKEIEPEAEAPAKKRRTPPAPKIREVPRQVAEKLSRPKTPKVPAIHRPSYVEPQPVQIQYY